ncbi:DUF5103 domain-containing protein [Pontibacter sp. BT310]|uniref:DUF5103 domain-containing protein n=1 Tax=Pontibacter populi TaxID=890055 RepID=A0ABS6XAA0_9BACT|nr:MULTISPECIES: DUF5103 domain-containing protein [Pontibacter]MBJ6118079.1 DUF5103 domain-containing protein [Pontibacter sp. BT310]MBR0570506.1 DUF5103 domain-containing protein [Microvirga sp. STS03]MBW3364932.1 DUF5103 domain-containing protein [Pontibacter populi]
MSRRFVFVLSLVFSLLTGCVPIEEQGQSGTSNQQTPIRYEDYIYNETIKSVQFYQATGVPDEVLEPAVTSLQQGRPILLEFDRLKAGPQRLVAKLIHCNYNWTPSNLTETQYLNDFNEFFITDVQNSVNTRVPYVHYRFRVPRVKMSGNYVLEVREEGGNLLLTRRMMVYENLTAVTSKLGLPAGPSGRQTRQPVEFNVFYQDYELINPAMEVKAVLRQNHRWDNAKFIPSPTFVRDHLKRLEYVFFEPKDNFLGLAEYRPFDTRSVRYNGIRVSSVNAEANPIEVFLQIDKNRSGEVYSQEPDINGKMLFNNREYGNGDVNSDYTWVDFELKASEEQTGQVYILGALTDWKISSDARMRYNAEKQVYNGRLLLKQGYYNYQYVLQQNQTIDYSYYEGSHFQTENSYDILIYYRPPGSRADLLIGYEEILFNRRR